MRKVAVSPVTVQMVGVALVKSTVKPELAVATSVSGTPTTCGGGAAKVMVCALTTA